MTTMTFWNGFRTWNMACVMSKTEQEHGAKQLECALGAEDRVRDIVAALGHTEHVHVRRRVFVPAQNRKREIDVIAITDTGVLVIEVKNWAGHVWKNGLKWYQKPPPTRAAAIEFFDIMGEHELKTQAVGDYLRDFGVDIPQSLIIPVLVFTSKNVTLDVSVRTLPNVFTIGAFTRSVAPRSPWREMLTHYVPFWGSQAVVSWQLKKDISEALRSVKTWDIVTLHNGTVQHGDVIGVELPKEGASLGRNDFRKLRVTWSNPNFFGLVASMWFGSACSLDISLKRALKRKGRPAKKNAAPELRISIPLLMPSGKDMKKKDRLIIRPAGKPFAEEIALIQVSSIVIGSGFHTPATAKPPAAPKRAPHVAPAAGTKLFVPVATSAVAAAPGDSTVALDDENADPADDGAAEPTGETTADATADGDWDVVERSEAAE